MSDGTGDVFTVEKFRAAMEAMRADAGLRPVFECGCVVCQAVRAAARGATPERTP